MSKPPPRGLIAKITITTPGTLCGAETPGAEERRLRARIAEARRDGDRDEHDFHVEALTALSLAQAWRDEQARPPRPPAAPVPNWLFGPRHRELDAQRRAAAEAARHELPELAPPAAPAPPTLEAITGYAVPATPEATPATRPLCPCCLRPMPPESP